MRKLEKASFDVETFSPPSHPLSLDAITGFRPRERERERRGQREQKTQTIKRKKCPKRQVNV